MYQYTDFDRRFVRARAAQYRDQLERHFAGQLSGDDFRALRLQNGWYIQRHAPMLRVAVPYGELSSRQLRQLARIAREYDRQPDGPFAGQGGYGHFTTRQNLQYNWIPLDKSADVMDLLAEVDMHGIQTSGNCIRNITSDALVGIAQDEIVDARPYAEVLRQWSTLHPEFAHLPRKFKIAVSGAAEDRAAIGWHDIGLQLKKNAAGEVGFQVFVGGGMGRTPIPGVEINAFVPWQHILVYIEAIVRCYNLAGRRDNLYKARIKILVKAEGQKFFDAVNAEYARILADDSGGHEHIIPQAELDRVAACFVDPAGVVATAEPTLDTSDPAFKRWLDRNVQGHRVAGYRAVTLSLKRVGIAPGDTSADVMDTAAALAEQFSHGELRVSHRQNLVLPWVKASDLPALFQAARAAGFATPNARLLTDQIACPGGDFCALANARSLPLAAEIAERYQDIDELEDLGEIDLHISGCINSCGHHHSGHIGILGVDKDGTEWYQLTLGGGDGSTLAGGTVAGKVIGPSFAADEIADAIDAVIETFKRERLAGEHFIDAVKRLGLDPFKTAANAVRVSTAKA
ncbi:nitrite/sulfite reductase [Pelomonas sp. UHG3]|uniref:Nitrite/sulfite reductase n=1 Tax=Roseateles hydrophilus TaxID=2975054 RepID=A0ACC6C5V1_9BURK|nr:nitrite/sulfite reductase [Pelomonas sp. UHG3]MCY4743786.1 nitrite/sulfite reductase [Pelomonas sp. UHG3]